MPDIFIKHPVQAGDTLQGIAIKYGVTTATIKRVNSLWSNDSIFVRENLLIPVPSDSSPDCVPDSGTLIQAETGLSADISPLRRLSQPVSGLCIGASSSPRHHGKFGQSQSVDCRETGESLRKPSCSESNGEFVDQNNVDIHAYFSKYDAVLSKLKQDAVKLEEQGRQHLADLESNCTT